MKKEFTDSIDINDLIQYELINNECYYIGDFTLAVFALKDYFKDMPNEELIKKVKEVYDNNINKILYGSNDEKIDI